MVYINAALFLGAAAALAHAHPGSHAGIPKLMGRDGPIDIQSLADRSMLAKRVVSPDETCGGTNAYTCGTSKCCSQYGWCGITTDHCGTGCQSAFGICTTATTSSAGSTPTNVDDTGRCGTASSTGSSCSATECCSPEGYCGTTEDYCMSPLCQEGYGKCDADTVPSGGSTDWIARPILGSVDPGDIYDCTVPGDIALTYDDGPYIYTDAVLDILATHNAKATFFITGINNAKGAIDTTPAWSNVIKKMDLAGHQMASHTWSHANLSSLTEASRRSEMYKLEMAMRNIVGKFPTYMRPPYSACDDACVATMAALGYHVTYFDLDTDDYNNETPALIQNAKNNFYNAINPSNPTTDAFLAIAHDIHEQTALNLTDYMLTTLTAKGYRAVTVGECLGDPSINWYRSSTPGATTTPTDATTTTTASNPTTTPTTSCAATAGAWCAAPLSTYTTISGCWTATDQCWTQGSTCWATVSGELGPQCGTYQGICKLVEAHCTSCVAAVGDGEGPCENYVSGV